MVFLQGEDQVECLKGVVIPAQVDAGNTPAVYRIGIIWFFSNCPVKIRHRLAETAHLLVGLALVKVDHAVCRVHLRCLVQRIGSVLIPFQLKQGETLVEPCICDERILQDCPVERYCSIGKFPGPVLGNPIYHPDVCMVGFGLKKCPCRFGGFPIPFLFCKNKRAVIPDPRIRRIELVSLFKGAQGFVIPPDLIKGNPHVVKCL